MTDVTTLDAIGASHRRIKPKGEMYLLVFIVIFGILGLALCLGLFGASDGAEGSGISQVEGIHDNIDRTS